MSHEHNFSRNATSIRWDEDAEEIVVSRACEGMVHAGTEVQIPSGRPSFQEKPCEAEEEQAYKVRTIVDYHDHHDEPDTHSVTVLDDASAANGMHKDELDEVPEWVTAAVKKARAKARDVDARYYMCCLGGPEISMTLATSETEYTVIMERVGERVVE